VTRSVLLALFALVFAVPLATADTYIEKFKSVDADKQTVTFRVDGKYRELKVDEKVDVQSQMRAGKKLRVVPVKDGLKGVKPGIEATISTETRAGEEIVTKIVLLLPEKN
jgi:hypothetical protein